MENVALVTGGTSGIGAAICDRLVRSGVAVIVNYHTDQDGALSLVNKLRTYGHAMAIYADVSDETEVKLMFDSINKDYGRLDVLVNNASYSHPDLWDKGPLEVSVEAWRRSIDVDLTGTYLCSREAVRLMLTSNGGKIVNFSSSGSLHGDLDTFVYNAAKVGVVALTKGFAKAFAPDIKCYAIAPGSIDSGWIERWNLDPTEVARLKALTLGLRRIGTSEEVAGLVSFLLSTDADYLTGQVLTFDGGTNL